MIDRSSIDGAFCTGMFRTFWIRGLLNRGLCLSRVAAVLIEVPSLVLMDIFSLKSPGEIRFKFLTLGGILGGKSYSISPDMNSLECCPPFSLAFSRLELSWSESFDESEEMKTSLKSLDSGCKSFCFDLLLGGWVRWLLLPVVVVELTAELGPEEVSPVFLPEVKEMRSLKRREYVETAAKRQLGSANAWYVSTVSGEVHIHLGKSIAEI